MRRDRLIASLMAIVLALFLAGCGDDGDQDVGTGGGGNQNGATQDDGGGFDY